MVSSLTPRLKKNLTQAGCYFERQSKGDHEFWHSPITEKLGYVPRPSRATLLVDYLQKIMLSYC
ncbi:type II toxin-antitoxin system HicA family toxin [Okeania sp. KiyG1]|uniref:type II toxin-antitoxin system HicA family toxin n=1 Tax=Okeania sp. KiyG1 TaxID=2720165 RepID=UPI0019231F5F|nr:type II toxin-antitoxin system HicA family toxin [Okeania sp. KiyG1]GGA43309.1 hypothetical protein CYANOKiyG1_61920 [Okeania sp. KiyG1]